MISIYVQYPDVKYIKNIDTKYTFLNGGALPIISLLCTLQNTFNKNF